MSEEPRAPRRFASGAVLGGKYVLREPIGAGGVGEVWSAVNQTTRGTLALKVVAAGSVSRDANARFRHEAALSASLAHRNIVRVYDLLEEPNGTLALVMELLRGETVRDRLLRTGLVPTASAVSIATQILSALSHSHAHGIVHRDIKPANIFLATEPDGEITPKLLDFGIAKTAASSVHTSHGQLLGTPRYMSPEQIRADAIDGRSDLFSVGIVLYELLTGRSPFAAGFATASLAAVLEASVAPDPLIPAALWSVLERALAKDRNDRYASADEFAVALCEAIKARQGSLSRVLVRSRPPPPIAFEAPMQRVPEPGETDEEGGPFDRAPQARRARGRRVVVATVALSLTVLIIGVVRSIVTHRAEGSVERSANVVAATQYTPDPPLPITNELVPRSVASVSEATTLNAASTAPSNAPPVSKTSATPRSSLARREHTAAERSAPAPAQRSPEIVRDPGF